jgi:hypothetical protein
MPPEVPAELRRTGAVPLVNYGAPPANRRAWGLQGFDDGAA